MHCNQLQHRKQPSSRRHKINKYSLRTNCHLCFWQICYRHQLF